MENDFLKWVVPGETETTKGGGGSGFWGHIGRPGKEGGGRKPAGWKPRENYWGRIRPDRVNEPIPESQKFTTDDEARELLRLARRGGFTYQPIMDTSPKEGVAVSLSGKGVVFKAGHLQVEDIKNFIDSRKDFFDSDPDAHVGGWYDAENGAIHLDISVVKKNRGEANRIAVEGREIAIFDLSSFEEIKTVYPPGLHAIPTKKRKPITHIPIRRSKNDKKAKPKI